MRILHVSPCFPVPPKRYGGIERIIYNLARVQTEQGHSVTVYSGAESSVPGCVTRTFTEFDAGGRWIRNKMIGSWHALNAYLHSGGFDIVHNHVAEEGVALSRFARAPCLTTLHGVAHVEPLPRLVERLSRSTMKTRLVGISKASYEGHRQVFGRDMIGYVYDGIDLRDYPFSAKPEKEHDIQLSFVGNLIPQKGPHLAIEVADRLAAAGEDVLLTMIGTTTPSYRDYYEGLAKLASERKHVRLAANASNEAVRQAIMNADAALFPYVWNEPFGLAVIEAMAYGTPVIATAKGAMTELIEPGRNGFLCPSFDDFPDAIHAVGTIARASCRSRVEDRFSAVAMERDYNILYARIADGSIGETAPVWWNC